MRIHGTVARWNDDRGFGFIAPAGAGAGTEIFVHICEYPRDGVRPSLGELVSFEVEVRGDGKQHAVRVMRPGSRTAPRHARHSSSTASRQSLLPTIIAVLALLAIGWLGYTKLNAGRSTPPTPVAHVAAIPAAASNPVFNCDGRTRCSQMTSCAEATFFIRQCPGTQMDGDGDGTPCESQWCRSNWAE